MRISTALFLAFCAVAPACSRGSAPPPPAAHRTSFGNVMAEVGRRFEVAGRAAAANRYELAEFEASELGELFEKDVPGAELPKEGPTAQLPALSKVFLETHPPALEKAAHAKDARAFADAFAQAAKACNDCHLASDKAFIQVPSVPGKMVPDVEPLPASSAAPR